MGVEFTILYERDEDGWWTAEIPEIPGVTAKGRSLENARTGVIETLRELSRVRREAAFRANHLDGFERLKLAA